MALKLIAANRGGVGGGGGVGVTSQPAGPASRYSLHVWLGTCELCSPGEALRRWREHDGLHAPQDELVPYVLSK